MKIFGTFAFFHGTAKIQSRLHKNEAKIWRRDLELFPGIDGAANAKF